MVLETGCYPRSAAGLRYVSRMTYTTHITVVDNKAGRAVHASSVDTHAVPKVSVDGKDIDTSDPGTSDQN